MLYLFLAEKLSFFCFVCFVAIICPILVHFKKKLKLLMIASSLIELKKLIVGKNYSLFGLGIAQPLRYSYSAKLLDLQTCN